MKHHTNINYESGVSNEKVPVKCGRNDVKIYLKMDVPSVLGSVIKMDVQILHRLVKKEVDI